MNTSDTIDLDAIFRVLADRLDCSCIEEAEYLGQRRWFADLLAEADSATPDLKENADDQLKHLRNLGKALGKALDALDAIDPAASVWLAAQSGLSELSQSGGLVTFRDQAARLKAAAQGPGSLAEHVAALPRKRWPSQGGVDWQARILALMIGRLYVLKRNRKLTFGQAHDCPNEPSTEYGRIVKESFAAGGVAARWDAAAEWAYREGMAGLWKKKRI